MILRWIFTMNDFRRGDIVAVLFPYSDHKTVKQRPALVVQADSLRTEFSQLIVAQITSKTVRAGRPSRIMVRLGDPLAAGTGLKSDSVIVADNLATVEHSLIRRTLGKMPDMSPVDTALRKALAL